MNQTQALTTIADALEALGEHANLVRIARAASEPNAEAAVQGRDAEASGGIKAASGVKQADARQVVHHDPETEAPDQPVDTTQAQDAAYYRWRLEAIMPLFEEARDALPAISLASAKLHGVDLTLGDRMDRAGTATRADFEASQGRSEVQR